MLGEYIKRVWEHDGSKSCDRCSEPVIYDVDSGYWIHARFGEVDGRNGLYCSPGMWEGVEPKHVARPT